MLTKEARDEMYQAGVQAAIEEIFGKMAGETMHPLVQKRVTDMRTQAMAEGNRYAKGYSPNVPMGKSEQALARSTPTAMAVKAAPAVAKAPAKPFDFGSAIQSASNAYTSKIK